MQTIGTNTHSKLNLEATEESKGIERWSPRIKNQLKLSSHMCICI